MSSEKVVFLAGGGTGGHIFPAKALYFELAKSGATPYLITDDRVKKYGVDDISTIYISAGSLSGSLLKKIKGALLLVKGTFEVLGLMKKYQPVAVVGFGGYPSFPTLIAAWFCKVDIYLHEQNAVLGRVNNLFSKKAKKLFLSFPNTMRVESGVLTELVGNPVRAELEKIPDLQFLDNEINILVLGGSQGAKVLSDVVPEAILKLPDFLKSQVKIVQQVKETEIKHIEQKYKTANIKAELAAFFYDIPQKLAKANLLISRAGASTLFEGAMAGRPMILIPLPTAMDDHQTYNALALVSAQGGYLLKQKDFSAESLSDLLTKLLQDKNGLILAGKNARKFANANAAKLMADTILKGEIK